MPTRMRSSGGRFMCTRPRSRRGKRQHRFALFTAPEERQMHAYICFRVFATHKYDLFEKRRPPRFTGLAFLLYYPRISPSQTTCRRSLCCDDGKNRSKNFKKPTAQAVLPPKSCSALLRVPKVANGSQSQQFGHHACTQCSQPFERWIVCEQRAK